MGLLLNHEQVLVLILTGHQFWGVGKLLQILVPQTLQHVYLLLRRKMSLVLQDKQDPLHKQNQAHVLILTDLQCGKRRGQIDRLRVSHRLQLPN